VKAKHPGISYADLYTLAGVVAIQAMGGPAIPWRAGRTDAADGKASPPDGRLPDATKKAAHLRDIFGRMGFNDKEIVALSGAHSLGRCHADRSGFVGPWTRAPTTFSNEYFRLLQEETWVPEASKAKGGPSWFVNKSDRAIMMLPSDLALTEDATFKKHVAEYAKDSAGFSKDFAAAFSRLLELGVPFPADSKPIVVKFK
jgi:cytochrome c peroxidase